METKYYLYCLADMILIATSLIYGVKLLKRRNYLLAGEWLVVTFSATNLLINAFTGAMPFYYISLFCDAFSRSFGIPVIAIAGLMAATHRYRPSAFADVTYFAVGLVVTTIVWTADFMVAPKPYFYLAAWSVFSLYLAYFVKRLLAAGEALHALSTTVSLVSSNCRTIASRGMPPPCASSSARRFASLRPTGRRRWPSSRAMSCVADATPWCWRTSPAIEKPTRS